MLKKKELKDKKLMASRSTLNEILKAVTPSKWNRHKTVTQI